MARYLTKEKKYRQKWIGHALISGQVKVRYADAVDRTLEWFDTGSVKALAHDARPVGRTQTVNFCPTGNIYTVGHALKDYTEWTRIARSAGGHYNNLTLINYHLVPYFSHIPLEKFNARHLRELALNVLESQPRHGFDPYLPKVAMDDLEPDQIRRRKRTFNSLVTILRMAFRHAWNNDQIQSERPWRCLNRVPVNHSPRTIFLNREECRRLLDRCTSALRLLVLGALYTGCRVGELGALRVEDVGKQGFGVRIGAFKRSPARFVFLPDEGMAFFLGCCDGKSGHDRVFRSDMGKIWRRQHCSLFKRAVAEARLPSKFVFHGLRHTYASDLVRSGVPLDVVAKQLGHANSITVSNTYGHLAEHYRERQIRTRFSPLSDEQQQEVKNREEQLSQLWQSVQTEDWRDYAQLKRGNSLPMKHFAQTSSEVLDLFARVDRPPE
ncbi:tyrosine-type recombinase/integrase [Aliiroseovarius sp. YM-037]|uniref:tyrosine-type recombinase/integrase n=1 Tax=Aliiroseovarius sp. YM-037 TaxID=3341728 RepID=UPI003A80A123